MTVFGYLILISIDLCGSISPFSLWVLIHYIIARKCNELVFTFLCSTCHNLKHNIGNDASRFKLKTELFVIHPDQEKVSTVCYSIWQKAKLLLTWIYWLLSDSFEHQLRRDSLFNRPYQGPLLPGCQLVANNESSEIWLVESPKGSEQSVMFPVIGGRLRQCIKQFKTKISTL